MPSVAFFFFFLSCSPSLRICTHATLYAYAHVARDKLMTTKWYEDLFDVFSLLWVLRIKLFPFCKTQDRSRALKNSRSVHAIWVKYSSDLLK